MAEKPKPPVDLLAALQASVDRARATRPVVLTGCPHCGRQGQTPDHIERCEKAAVGYDRTDDGEYL